MKKKGQAAMEFLMTYGWAILVVVAAIAVLAASGILNLSGFLPEKCQFPVEMSCVGGKASIDQTNDWIIIPLRNSIGYKANITSASIVDDDGTTACTGAVEVDDGTGYTDLASDEVEINNEAVFRLRFNTCGFTASDVGNKFIGTATVNYENQESGIVLPAVGDLSGRIA